MINISNALFEFTSQLVEAATSDEAVFQATVHADIYEEIRSGKTIRIDDIRNCKPVLIGSGEIRRDKAIVSVHFLKMPVTQKLTDRLEARQTAENMATEWLKAYFNNPKLTDENGFHRVCNTGEVIQFNDWIKPGAVKIPVTVLRLLINP